MIDKCPECGTEVELDEKVWAFLCPKCEEMVDLRESPIEIPWEGFIKEKYPVLEVVNEQRKFGENI